MHLRHDVKPNGVGTECFDRKFNNRKHENGGDDCEGDQGGTLEHWEYNLPASRYSGYMGYTYIKYRESQRCSLQLHRRF